MEPWHTARNWPSRLVAPEYVVTGTRYLVAIFTTLTTSSVERGYTTTVGLTPAGVGDRPSIEIKINTHQDGSRSARCRERGGRLDASKHLGVVMRPEDLVLLLNSLRLSRSDGSFPQGRKLNKSSLWCSETASQDHQIWQIHLRALRRT